MKSNEKIKTSCEKLVKTLSNRTVKVVADLPLDTTLPYWYERHGARFRHQFSLIRAVGI